MFRFYPLVLLIQVFCIYHAYTNKTDQKWYWIIIFFPFIGSLIYLYDTFFKGVRIENIAEGAKHTFLSNYKIEQLEKQLKFSDTVANKLELAEELSNAGDYDRAISLYKDCLEHGQSQDTYILMQLVKNYYLLEDYQSAVDYGSDLEGKKEFQKSEEKIAFAWSNFQLQRLDIAEKLFTEMDKPFSNYQHRIEYAHFLLLTDRKSECRDKLGQLLEEIDSMDPYEKRQKRLIHKQIKQVYKQISD
jgi:hypothetical protein